MATMVDSKQVDGSDSFSTSPKARKDDKLRLVTSLKSVDVLMGRGNGPNDHLGNGAFRNHIEDMLDEYMGTISRKAKDKIASRVVRAVKARQGRFVRRLTKIEKLSRGISAEKIVYLTVDDEAAVQKSKQAFRYVYKATKKLALCTANLAAQGNGDPFQWKNVVDTPPESENSDSMPLRTYNSYPNTREIDETPMKSKQGTTLDLLSSVAIALERLDAMSCVPLRAPVNKRVEGWYCVHAFKHDRSMRLLKAPLMSPPMAIRQTVRLEGLSSNKVASV